MPRYFFDIQDGRAFRDVEGNELSGRLAAQRHALALASDLIRESRLADTDGCAVVVSVRDAAGDPVLTAHVVTAVEIHEGPVAFG